MSKRVTCQTCKRQSTAVAIGTASYCALCGSRTEATAEVAQTAATPATLDAKPVINRNVDISRGNAPVVNTRGTSAKTLHHATHTLDLREAKPITKRRGTVSVPNRPKPVAAPKPPTKLISSAPIAEPVSQPTPTPDPRHRHDEAKMAARLERAKAIGKSEHISRFGAGERLVASMASPMVVPGPQLPPAAALSHQDLRRYIPATAPAAKSSAAPKLGHYATVAAAVALMGGYIWFQNYPNLTIQSAASKAGVAATSPSYIPTSYNLTGTSSQPGLLTLSFKSPSLTTALTIDQARTSWDTKTLADTVVAKADPTFTSINGQGLTIYLYNKNQAAWVNHGIWYTIKGTARLSREEVLKIAYGL